MSLWKRALLYITRNRGRNGVLLALVVALACVAMIGISAQGAASSAAGMLRRQLGGYFRVETSSDSAPDEGGGRLAQMDSALADRLAEDGRIRAVNGTNSYYLYAAGLDLEPARYHGSGLPQEHVPVFLANTDTEWAESFTNGAFRLARGGYIAGDETGRAIISEALARRNGLGLGDTFTAGILVDPAGETAKVMDPPLTFEIAGLFEIVRKEAASAMAAESDLYENYIFIGQADGFAINERTGRRTNGFSGGITCYLNDPGELEAVQADLLAQSDIDWRHFAMRDSIKAYEDIAAPLAGIERVGRLLLFIILALGLILITLVLLLWMRDRVREIGILTSIGVTKRKLVAQFLAENLFVTVVSVLFAFVIARFALAGLAPVVNGTLGEAADIAAVSVLVEEPRLELSLGPAELLMVLAGSCCVVAASTAVSSGIVLRRNPSKILVQSS